MNHKAFTLIELLVVVAIIGILAAVGVVAYNGYTKSAKVNASKTNHRNVVKSMSAEIKKCDLGQELILKYSFRLLKISFFCSEDKKTLNSRDREINVSITLLHLLFIKKK